MKKLICLLSAFCLLVGQVDAKRRTKARRATTTHVQKKSKVENRTEDFISAKQAILIDCETGKELYGLNADERCAPSSMTKLMTLYILFSEISKKHIKLQDEFQVSELAQQQEGSRSFFKAGTMTTVEDLIRSIIVHSGNDACIVVAEGICGDVSAFVKEMNEFAQAFGLENTHFTNPIGLPDEDHYSTARDLAKIARKVAIDFPQFYHYFSEKEFTVNGISQPNRNKLIGNSLGVDGMKTGHTNAGGFGIVVSAVQKGRRLISVVNGCKGTAQRAKDSSKLLAMGFRDFVSYKIADAGVRISEAKVWLGKKPTVGACCGETIAISIPKKLQDSIKIEAKMNEPIEAPIKLGDKIGELVYKYDGYISKQYPLFATENIEKLDWWDRAVFTIKTLFLGNNGEVCNVKVQSAFIAPQTNQLLNK